MLDKAKPMNSEDAISAIKSNWPDARYSMLREALEIAITALEERDKLVKVMEKYAVDDTVYCGRCDGISRDDSIGEPARRILSEIKGQGDESQ